MLICYLNMTVGPKLFSGTENHRAMILYFFEEHGAFRLFILRGTITESIIWFRVLESAGLPPAILDGHEWNAYSITIA